MDDKTYINNVSIYLASNYWTYAGIKRKKKKKTKLKTFINNKEK